MYFNCVANSLAATDGRFVRSVGNNDVGVAIRHRVLIPVAGLEPVGSVAAVPGPGAGAVIDTYCCADTRCGAASALRPHIISGGRSWTHADAGTGSNQAPATTAGVPFPASTGAQGASTS